VRVVKNNCFGRGDVVQVVVNEEGKINIKNRDCGGGS